MNSRTLSFFLLRSGNNTTLKSVVITGNGPRDSTHLSPAQARCSETGDYGSFRVALRDMPGVHEHLLWIESWPLRESGQRRTIGTVLFLHSINVFMSANYVLGSENKQQIKTNSHGASVQTRETAQITRKEKNKEI